MQKKYEWGKEQRSEKKRLAVWRSSTPIASPKSLLDSVSHGAAQSSPLFLRIAKFLVIHDLPVYPYLLHLQYLWAGDIFQDIFHHGAIRNINE